MGMDLDSGNIRALNKDQFDELFKKATELESLLNRTSIFRINDEVDIHNRSLPSQPTMRFRILDFDPKEGTLTLKGIPSI